MITVIRQWFHAVIIWFRRWVNTPPGESDMFFVRIRQMKQSILPCKHDWQEIGPYARRCSICTERQIMMLHKFGEIRYSWQSIGHSR